MIKEHVWEKVEGGTSYDYHTTSRMKVPGGWLYQYSCAVGEDRSGITMVFVPASTVRKA